MIDNSKEYILCAAIKNLMVVLIADIATIEYTPKYQREKYRKSTELISIMIWGIVYGDYVPSGCKYRKAQKHHIKKFIRDICKDEAHCRIYAEEIKYLQTLI